MWEVRVLHPEQMKEKQKFYAGIGSRSTPKDLRSTIKEIVEILNEKGYTLRSGGADGADTFFEEYANNKEIYLPWPGFNGHDSELNSVCDRAYDLAEQFHPAWQRLSYGVKKLIARNGYQILGQDLNSPVDLVICWTPNGKVTGGTAQGIKISNHFGIKVFNLFSEIEECFEYIREL